MQAFKDIEDKNEEFNNFMHRVTNVNNIVKKLASNDSKLQQIGTLEADEYLKDKSCIDDTTIVENIKVTVKSNRTLINKAAFRDEPKDENTMSQEAFMKEVGRDADQRFKERKIRQEKSDTFKTRANKAFRRDEIELALSLYSKAIEHIKDSPLLYLNRALCQIKLERYKNAIEDAETALKFNENSLKAWLLIAKCHFSSNDMGEFKTAVCEAKERNPEKLSFIEEYVEDLKNSQ